MDAWAEIKMNNIAWNLDIIRGFIDDDVRVCGVIKGDAYGHGLPGFLDAVSRRSLLDMAAVGRTTELVQAFTECLEEGPDLLLLGRVETREIEELLKEKKIRPKKTIFSLYHPGQLSELEALGEKTGVCIRIHIRTDSWDSGMGMEYREFLAWEDRIFRMEHLDVCGLYSHMYSSYSDSIEDIRREMERFDAMVRRIRPEHRRKLTIHLLNSPLIFRFPEYAYDMVRTGSSMYGFNCGNPRTRLAMRICARVVDVREVPSEALLSYAMERSGGQRRRIARLMLGYWDCPLLLTQKNVRARINGRLYPLADHICMDSMCLDITDGEGISTGDLAVLLGEPGVTEEEIFIRSEIPRIHGESVCMTAQRLVKRYI